MVLFANDLDLITDLDVPWPTCEKTDAETWTAVPGQHAISETPKVKVKESVKDSLYYDA